MDSTKYEDIFILDHVYKSVFVSNSNNYIDEIEKPLSKSITKINKKKYWFRTIEEDDSFRYYYQDGFYYFVPSADTLVLFKTKSIYSANSVRANGDINIHLFVFTSPLEFTTIEFSTDYNFDLGKTVFVKVNEKTSKVDCITESDLYRGGHWKIKWVYSNVYLFDHSYFIVGQEGPFVLFDISQNKVIISQKK